MTAGGVGRIEAIWLKRVRRGVMDAVPAAELEADRGLVGNANRGGRRQVTIIEEEAWREMMAELGADIDPSARRANLMVSGLRLRKTRGAILEVGGCRLQVQGETRPCNLMEETLPGLQQAMSPAWRGGVFATVLTGGRIGVGDTITLLPQNLDLFEAHASQKGRVADAE